jgi:hypothetical protein
MQQTFFIQWRATQSFQSGVSCVAGRLQSLYPRGTGADKATAQLPAEIVLTSKKKVKFGHGHSKRRGPIRLGFDSSVSLQRLTNQMKLSRLRSALAVLIVPAVFPVSTFAQEKPSAEPQEKGDKELPSEKRIVFPSPHARLIGIENALKKKAQITIDWKSLYQQYAARDLNMSKLKGDKATLAVAAGMRLADAVVALKAEDATLLKACARDVKTAAERLGVTKADLASGDQLMRAIDDGKWSEIYFELGMVQQEVVTRLDTEQDRSATALLASGAWLQGVRYATSLIVTHREKLDLSNMLRAAPIPDQLAGELAKVPAALASEPVLVSVTGALRALKPLIDVKRDEAIPPDRLETIRKLATDALTSVK